jgi:hypothetical protein
VRNIRLESAATLERSDVRALIDAALQRAKTQLPAGGSHQLIIKSVSAQQRPRRIAVVKKERNGKKKHPR